ncbi:MAG: hypothetical protein JWM47_2132 [Acidimicrobiales bacterium]|nr:hypothetical protein [Acidimicrobiales bacterium]
MSPGMAGRGPPAGTVDVMERLRPYPVAAFAGLTSAIWGNRIWLAWTNPDDTVAEKLVWSTPITLFVLAALAVAVAYARDVDRGGLAFRRLVQVFAGGTVTYWAIRLPMILLADHGVPFKVVHTVLALVSVAAAAAAWRSVGRADQRRPPAPAAA